MLNKLSKELISAKELLSKIKLCDKCNNGYIQKTLETKMGNFDLNLICDCQKINNIDAATIREKIEELNYKISEIKKSIPQDYWYNVFFEKQNKILHDFMNNDKVFLWIWSNVNGNGKTSALQSIRINQIMKGKIYLMRIVKEVKFSYLTDIEGFLSIDDVYKLKDDSRLKYLLPIYYALIDHKNENKEKMIFTSNSSLEDFIAAISSYDKDIAKAIHNRMYNTTDILAIDNKSYRQ
jgi:hypothetical protein